MTCILPFAAEMHELGMARLINVPACLELYAAVYQGEELCIHLQGDEAIGENNGYYSVSSGKMIQGYHDGKRVCLCHNKRADCSCTERPSSLYEPDVGLILKAHLHS